MNHNNILSQERQTIFQHLKTLSTISQFHLSHSAGVILQKKHRMVEDISFFAFQSFDLDEVIQHLQKVFDVTVVLRTKTNCSLIVESSKISFNEYPYPPIHEPLLTEWGFFMSNLLDIGALLMLEIIERPSRKDYVDLYFIYRDLEDLEPLLETFVDRFPEEKYDRKKILHVLSHFDETIKEEIPTLFEQISWREIKTFLTVDSKKLYYNEKI